MHSPECESSPLHKIGLKMSYRCSMGNLPGKAGTPSGGDGIMVPNATFFSKPVAWVGFGVR